MKEQLSPFYFPSDTIMRIKLRKSQTTIEWEKVDKNIKSLEILGDSIEKIKDLESYHNLESLYLNCPCLSDYPKLPIGIKTLKVKSSCVTSIWLSYLESLSQLENLQLSDTKISYLPSSFFSQMTILKVLDLKGNRLSEVPSSFKQLNTIARINLDHNELSSLPDFLYQMKQIHHLSLDSNPLSEQTKQKLYQAFGIWF